MTVQSINLKYGCLGDPGPGRGRGPGRGPGRGLSLGRGL